MKSNIALIGFMAAGKSTVGRALSRRLRMSFVEIDSLIEERAGKSISAIFRNDGEPVFREIESKTAAEISQCQRTVISCGGGIVLNPANMEHLKKNATIVYLQTDPEVILHRVERSSEIRPLLSVKDPPGEIRKLLSQRCPLYEQAADIIVDTSDLDVGNVVNDIMAELSEKCGL